MTRQVGLNRKQQPPARGEHRKVVPWSIDVLSPKPRRIQTLEAIGRLLAEGADPAKSAMIIDTHLAPLWGRLGQGDFAPHDKPKFERLACCLPGALASIRNVAVSGCVVRAPYALHDVVRSTIQHSLVIGDAALSGEYGIDSLEGPKTQYALAAYQANYVGDRRRVDYAMQGFAEAMNEKDTKLAGELVEWSARIENGQAPRMDTTKAPNDFALRRACETGNGNQDYSIVTRHTPRPHAYYAQFGEDALTACALMTHLDCLRSSVACDVSIRGSVVFGEGALKNVLGGVIENSIVGGPDVLDGSHVYVVNSFVVDGAGPTYIDGRRYMGEGLIGHPGLPRSYIVPDPKGVNFLTQPPGEQMALRPPSSF